MAQAPLILIADDESPIVHVLSVKLEHAGFRIVTARDGREALASVRSDTPDLVIIDFQMPHLTGIEVSAAMRRIDRTRKVPVILLTAQSHALESAETEDVNIQAMISKPFSPREVLNKVYELLGMSHDEEVARAS
jgi:CheY-like chemotaxis protein